MNFSINSNVPQGYLCPITHQLMNNPVVDNEGNSYEQSAILEWLSRNNTSPITRNPLDTSQLSPNRALKDLIDEYKLKNGISTEENSNDSSIHREIDMTPFELKVTSKGSQSMISINHIRIIWVYKYFE